MNNDAIVLTGVKETLKALESFDKETVRNFNKVLNNELSSVKKEAQSLVSDKPPLSGWSTQPAANPRSRGGAGWPAWDQSVIKSGISVTKAQGRVRKDYTTSMGTIKNKAAAGVIYEVTGRKNKSGGKNGFISNLSSKDSPFMPSRLVWHAVDKQRAKIIENVLRAFDDVKSKLQKNLEKERV